MNREQIKNFINENFPQSGTELTNFDKFKNISQEDTTIIISVLVGVQKRWIEQNLNDKNKLTYEELLDVAIDNSTSNLDEIITGGFNFKIENFS